MERVQVFAITLFFITYLLFLDSLVIPPASANQTVVHHQPSVTVITYSRKPTDDWQCGQPVALEWSFPQDTAVTLNLLLTAPATILTRDAVAISQNHPSAGEVFHYQVVTAVKSGRLELITEGAFLDAQSYVETHADNSPWSVVIKRADKLADKNKESFPVSGFADFPGITPSTIKSAINAGGYGGTGGQDDARRKPRRGGFFHENNMIATLTHLHLEDNDKTPAIIFVVIATDNGQHYDLITPKEWNDLKDTGKANITGLMELVRSHLEAHREYQDAIALIHQTLQRQQQDIFFDEDDTLLSTLLDGLKPPAHIEILAPDSPPFVYLGKKKGKTPAPANNGEKAKSKNTPAHSGSIVDAPPAAKKTSSSQDDELPPPEPPGATAVSTLADIAVELDIPEIIFNSYNHTTITEPPFIMALYGANLLTLEETRNFIMLSEQLAAGGDHFELVIPLTRSMLDVAEKAKGIESKLLYLRLLHTYLQAKNNRDLIACLLDKIPARYHGSVQRRHEFSATLFQEQPSSSILRRLVAFSTVIPGSASRLLRQYPARRDSPYIPERSVAELLWSINLPSDLVIAWGYIKELLTTGQLAAIVDIPQPLASGINDFHALFTPQGTTFSFSGFEFLLEPDSTGTANADIGVSIFDRFHPLSPEFRRSGVLAKELLNGQSINSALADMTSDEILMTLAMATRKLGNAGKINGSQIQVIQTYLKMQFQASRGILPDEIITLPELAAAFDITISSTPGRTDEIRVATQNAVTEALMRAFFKNHGPVYQYFSQPAAEQISGLLSAFEKKVVEIGAGHGMLSSALGRVGFSVSGTTDIFPPFFPCFDRPVTRKTAIDALREYGDTVIYIASSPTRSMMLDLVDSGLKAVFVLIGSSLWEELGEKTNVHQIPLVLNSFHTLAPARNTLLFLNVGEAERRIIEERIPHRLRLVEKKKKRSGYPVHQDKPARD